MSEKNLKVAVLKPELFLKRVKWRGCLIGGKGVKNDAEKPSRFQNVKITSN